MVSVAALSPVAGGQIAQAQGTIGARVEAVRDGLVRMSFAARPGVCGSGNGWSRTRVTGNGTTVSASWGSKDVEYPCEAGPVRLVVVRSNGEIKEMRTNVGGRWRTDTGVTDLGTVSARDAGRWLLTLAERAPDVPARAAIHALTIADSVDAWAAFLRIAKDEQRPKDVRNQAIFWLGEFAGDKVTASLDSIAYEPGDREVRKQAIFAVSRRPNDEAVTTLLHMAETLPDRELRKTAIFWLSRSSDPRALAWLTKALDAK
jgi:hypothetical protein